MEGPQGTDAEEEGPGEKYSEICTGTYRRSRTHTQVHTPTGAWGHALRTLLRQQQRQQCSCGRDDKHPRPRILRSHRGTRMENHTHSRTLARTHTHRSLRGWQCVTSHSPAVAVGVAAGGTVREMGGDGALSAVTSRAPMGASSAPAESPVPAGVNTSHQIAVHRHTSWNQTSSEFEGACETVRSMEPLPSLSPS